jgi:hypothetical protein
MKEQEEEQQFAEELQRIILDKLMKGKKEYIHHIA